MIGEVNSHRWYTNHECEYYPCHEVGSGHPFNCLFCYCPLYSRMTCGGEYTILPNGIKDCSACILPHIVGGYQYIVPKLIEGE